jgi:hypothetical protein
VQRRKPESSEATAARKRRERQTVRWLVATCQNGLPLAEAKRRIDDWESATGQSWLASKEPGLNALEHVLDAQRVTRPWRYPLIILKRRGAKVDRTGEPWAVRVSEQMHWEHFGSADYSLFYDTVELYFLSKSWGRYERKVTFIDEGGERVCRSVPAARAAGKARSIPITVDLDRLYRGALVREWQRWRRREPGDWTARKWDVPELSTWRCNVNRGFFKLPIPGNVDPAAFAPVRWWPGHYPLPPGSYRELIAHDWGERFDPENSGVSRRCRVPKLFNQVLRRLERDVEKECADAIDDDRSVDGRKLDRPLPYDPNGKRVALEFFSDGSLAVHWECEKRNRGRMRGNIPFNSTTKACCGIIGHVQLSLGWAARPPIPNRDVALAVLRSGKLPTPESVKAYWWKRLGTQAVEIRARALTAKCEAPRPVRAFCKFMQRKEKSWYKDLCACHVGGAQQRRCKHDNEV